MWKMCVLLFHTVIWYKWNSFSSSSSSSSLGTSEQKYHVAAWVVTHSAYITPVSSNWSQCSFSPINPYGESIYNWCCTHSNSSMSRKTVWSPDPAVSHMINALADLEDPGWYVQGMYVISDLEVRGWGVGGVHWVGADPAWWVRRQGSRGRAKAERWSPSVSQANSKVAITQDWLARSPLAPWLFLSFHFFLFFVLYLFSPVTIDFSLFLLKIIFFHFRCLSFSFTFVPWTVPSVPCMASLSFTLCPYFLFSSLLFFFLTLVHFFFLSVSDEYITPLLPLAFVAIASTGKAVKNQISVREHPDPHNRSAVMTTRYSRAWRPLYYPSI